MYMKWAKTFVQYNPVGCRWSLTRGTGVAPMWSVYQTKSACLLYRFVQNAINKETGLPIKTCPRNVLSKQHMSSTIRWGADRVSLVVQGTPGGVSIRQSVHVCSSGLYKMLWIKKWGFKKDTPKKLHEKTKTFVQYNPVGCRWSLTRGTGCAHGSVYQTKSACL